MIHRALRSESSHICLGRIRRRFGTVPRRDARGTSPTQTWSGPIFPLVRPNAVNSYVRNPM